MGPLTRPGRGANVLPFKSDTYRSDDGLVECTKVINSNNIDESCKNPLKNYSDNNVIRLTCVDWRQLTIRNLTNETETSSLVTIQKQNNELFRVHVQSTHTKQYYTSPTTTVVNKQNRNRSRYVNDTLGAPNQTYIPSIIIKSDLNCTKHFEKPLATVIRPNEFSCKSETT